MHLMLRIHSLHPCYQLHGSCSQCAWALKIQGFQKGVWLRGTLSSCSPTSFFAAEAAGMQSRLA